MKLIIEKIRLNQLKAFVESETFNQFEYIPISALRAESYLHNPHALPEDVVLYLGFVDNKLVAFRTLFAGSVFDGDQRIRFGWCSGNWVHPNYRRRGFSEQLLTDAYSDWDQKLMFTNYAPNSEQLYLKTGWFSPIHQFEGVRAYLFPKTRKLVADSNKNHFKRIFYSILDFDIKLISSFRLLFYHPNSAGNFCFKLIEKPDEECYAFLSKHFADSFFQRNEQEIKWIFKYPWLSNSENEQNKKYPFSCYSNDFRYQTIKIYAGEIFQGFCIFSVRDKHLKSLYFSCPNEVIPELADFMKSYSRKHKIEVLTLYKKELAAEMLKRNFPFLRTKKYGQKIYSTFTLPAAKNHVFQDGDGDVFFT